MISRELAHLAGEARGAVGEENLDLGEAAGIEKQLPRGRIARRVLGPEGEVELPAERHPRRLAAPARLHELAFQRQETVEGRHALRGLLLLEPGGELELAGGYAKHRGDV